MQLSIDENLSPVPFKQRILTTVVQPAARTRPFKSQMMPYRSQSLPSALQTHRKPNPEEGQTYTVHRDMSGLKSDLLGRIIDLYA